MTDRLALYGTDAPPPVSQDYTFGKVSFSYENGALRHIKLDGAEAIRNIAFLVRDRDWGTLEPVISDVRASETGSVLNLSYHASYLSHGASLDVDIRITVTATGLRVAASGVAKGGFETNRTGFSVLHPIDGVAGAPVTVEHSDGSAEGTHFPDLIAPWQPFQDITGLVHQVGTYQVACRFQGDTFEMEDQRQWGDASYKTYNRPLALPWPYSLADGARLEQAVDLSWQVAPTAAVTAKPTPAILGAVPEMALVITPAEAADLARHPQDLDVVQPKRLLCHVDATLGDTRAQFDSFRRAQIACPDVAYDLEMICGFDETPEHELRALAADMQASGFAPDSVMICPSVDRQSTPPGSDWPACPPLTDIHRAAARAFPDVTRGGGMVSLFTELNRKRPPVAQLDFVSHGLCPTVHAADDLSVMETLEAMPHITRSMRAIIGDKPYRIGPATLAMRQNPYGSRTMPNPDRQRLCMSDDDPRHRAQFGAAYVIGLVTSLVTGAPSVWTPAALYGPRGVMRTAGQTEGRYPLADPLRVVSEMAGQSVDEASIEGGMARLIAGGVMIEANLTAMPNGALARYGWRSTPVPSGRE